MITSIYRQYFEKKRLSKVKIKIFAKVNEIFVQYLGIISNN